MSHRSDHLPRELTIERRRELVAEYRVKNMTLSEITQQLEIDGVVNKEGKAYSLNTISKDVRAIRKQWQEQYADHFEELQKKHFLEVELLKKKLWKAGNHEQLIKLLDHDAKILGLFDDKKNNIQINNIQQGASALPSIVIKVEE